MTKISGLLMTIGFVLIILGAMTWTPISYLGLLVFIAGVAARNYMHI